MISCNKVVLVYKCLLIALDLAWGLQCLPYLTSIQNIPFNLIIFHWMSPFSYGLFILAPKPRSSLKACTIVITLSVCFCNRCDSFWRRFLFLIAFSSLEIATARAEPLSTTTPDPSPKILMGSFLISRDEDRKRSQFETEIESISSRSSQMRPVKNKYISYK